MPAENDNTIRFIFLVGLFVIVAAVTVWYFSATHKGGNSQSARVATQLPLQGQAGKAPSYSKGPGPGAYGNYSYTNSQQAGNAGTRRLLQADSASRPQAGNKQGFTGENSLSGHFVSNPNSSKSGQPSGSSYGRRSQDLPSYSSADTSALNNGAYLDDQQFYGTDFWDNSDSKENTQGTDRNKYRCQRLKERLNYFENRIATGVSDEVYAAWLKKSGPSVAVHESQYLEFYLNALLKAGCL